MTERQAKRNAIEENTRRRIENAAKETQRKQKGKAGRNRDKRKGKRPASQSECGFRNVFTLFSGDFGAALVSSFSLCPVILFLTHSYTQLSFSLQKIRLLLHHDDSDILGYRRLSLTRASDVLNRQL